MLIGTGRNRSADRPSTAPVQRPDIARWSARAPAEQRGTGATRAFAEPPLASLAMEPPAEGSRAFFLV